jgi:citronellol/citronellal dehydrogenase
VHVNSLWPVTTIATAAVKMLGGNDLLLRSRKPEIVADAAHWILTRSGKKWNGKFFLDEQILAFAGITDLYHYAVDPSKELRIDLYVEPR